MGRTARTVDVCILGGCGRVGLPLGLAFANTGLHTDLYDIDSEVVAQVNAGEMPFLEAGAQEVLDAVIGKTLTATTSPDAISRASCVIIVIGTPVDRHLNPDFAAMLHLLDDIKEYLRDGQLLILRSTVFPGTSTRLHQRLQELDLRIHLSYCPERIAEGNALKELGALPHIISGFDDAAIARARTLFEHLGGGVVVLQPIEAELAKLFTNAWRYIKFAIANQFFMITNECGVDFHNIYRAMRHNYPRAQDFPSAGFAAGPCLFKDTMQLAEFYHNQFFLGHAAMLINEGLPNHIVSVLQRTVPLREMTIGILGMAFKADSDDPRDSLSYKLGNMLESVAAKVLRSDPYIHNPKWIDAKDLIRQSEVIIIGAPHTAYRDLGSLMRHKIVVDVWNAVVREAKD